MVAVAAENELLQSCEVLFGSGLNMSTSFLDYIQISGIKTAYRQRVKETHPDLVIRLGENMVAESQTRFLKVQKSYENLKDFIAVREENIFSKTKSTCSAASQNRPPATSDDPSGWTNQTATDRNAGGNAWNTTGNTGFGMPRRQLMFGHFLYYATLIQWHDVTRALVWQRAGRPRVGELGRKLGWLKKDDFLTLLKSRKSGQKFGEVAVEQGCINQGQLDRLLFYQKCHQKKIGQYFLEQGLLNSSELATQLQQFHSHNFFFTATGQ